MKGQGSIVNIGISHFWKRGGGGVKRIFGQKLDP
jgi:hypothetical protein